MSEFAWLDDEPVPAVVDQATQIKIKPVTPTLSEEQTLYLQVLRHKNWKPAVANQEIATVYKNAISQGTIDAWWEDDFFCAVVETWKKKSLVKKGVTPTQVLLDTRRVVDYALEKAPILYKGEPTGYYERDLSNALKGLELLGRNQKVWTETEKASVHVEIELIDWAGPKPIEGEATVIDGEQGS